MSKQSIMVVSVQTEKVSELTWEELSSVCRVSPKFIEEVIEFGIIDPVGNSPDDWAFSDLDMRRIRTVLHLQEDLEVNMAGAALVLELMDELETLRSRVEILEKKGY